MKIAWYFSDNVYASWHLSWGYPRTLERLGHKVLYGPVPPIRVMSRYEYEEAVAKLPTYDEMRSADAVFVVGPEYILPWLDKVYGQDWREIKTPKAFLYLETERRKDHPLDYSALNALADFNFYPDPFDAEKHKGTWLPFGVDTNIFRPDGNRVTYLNRVHRRPSCGFIGTMYGARAKFFQPIERELRELGFRVGEVQCRDLFGQRSEMHAEILAENLRNLDVQLCPPSNNATITVTRPLESLACGCLPVTYHTADNLLLDGEAVLYDGTPRDALTKLRENMACIDQGLIRLKDGPAVAKKHSLVNRIDTIFKTVGLMVAA